MTDLTEKSLTEALDEAFNTLTKNQPSHLVVSEQGVHWGAKRYAEGLLSDDDLTNIGASDELKSLIKELAEAYK